MLNERQIELLPERITERLNKINAEYLERIGSVIKEIGELRPSDIHKLQQMYQYGSDGKKMAEKLAKASEKNIEEIYEMFDIVAKENYNYAKPFYKAKKKPFIKYEKNEDLQKYVKSIAKQTVDEYVNLTQHTAFAVFAKDGKSIAPLFENNKNKLATSLSDTYTKVIDYAVTKVQTGATDYNSEMRSCLKALADSGIKTVDYATGYSRRLDTAVRQNILWGIKECNQNVADMVGEEFGADGYEISYHSHPRPSHDEMGGQQYAIGKARTVNGVYYPSFSDVEPLLEDYGCLHFKFSILLGISQPAYSKEQLEELKAEDKKTFEFEGKEYTKYEASQMQRRIETAIRNEKDRAIIAKSAGNDDLRREAQYKINLLTDKYAKLSDVSGLPTKMERLNVKGFRKVSANTNNIAFNVKPGKDNNAVVDIAYIHSRTYVDKFRGISGQLYIDDIICQLCTTVLKNRNGTYFEELYAIDARNGRTLTYIKGREKNSIQMTEKLKNILTNARENSIIIVHNHPNSSTFSTTDISTMIDYKSIHQTIACAHDGAVFSISGIPRDKQILKEFVVRYSKHKEKWSDFTAREKAWQDISEKWRFLYGKR